MFFLLCAAAFAEEPGAPIESQAFVVQPKPAKPGGFAFLGLFQSRSTATNLTSTNPFLDGQVVGQMGGSNGVIADPDALSVYSEERAVGFLTYKPPVLSGQAELVSAFEIDFGFGDRAYGTGGNTGGAFGADQVNLQTRRLYAGFRPKRGQHSAHVLLGLQFVGDTVNDPTETGPDGLFRSGGRLMVWGSEAAGLSAYGKIKDASGDLVKYRLGTYTLYEQATGDPDDVWLNMADVEYLPAWGVTVGAHAWYLQDRSGGSVGALGVGPTSALSELQGGPRLDPFDGGEPPDDSRIYSDVFWVGLDGGYNAPLTYGPFGVSGVLIANLGRIYAPAVQDYAIGGFLVDAEARYRYAQGEGSVARVEATVATADDADRAAYTGVLTGNSWGVAGAVPTTHGHLLLMPDGRAINRMVSVVSDVSGAGRGLVAIHGDIGYDPIPDRLTVNAGVGHARTADGEAWGTEIRGKVTAEPLLMCNVSVNVATVIPGSASGLTANPWTGFVAVDWLVF